MQWKKHIFFINLIIIHTFDRTPCDCSSFRCGKILYCMEGKTCEICSLSTFLSFSLCAKCMCSICHHNHSAKLLLKFICRMEKWFLCFYNFKYLIIVTHNSGKIYRDNRFRLLCDCICQLLIIHLVRIFCHIHQNQFCTYMLYYTGWCSISIGSCNYFISRSNSQKTQCHLQAGCCWIQTDHPVCFHIFWQFLFKKLRLWSCCDPATS